MNGGLKIIRVLTNPQPLCSLNSTPNYTRESVVGSCITNAQNNQNV